MYLIDYERLQEYRKWNYRLLAERKITKPAEVKEFINERGFIFFWSISGIDLPSLWTAVAGDQPVADEHDNPFHITWDWKDDGLDKRQWYYAKILRRKATFISLETIPYFYALTANYGSPEEDHIIAYQDGLLTLEAKNVYEALLQKGPLNTIDLRKEARLQNAKESTFNRAMEDLQKDLKILPVGIAEAGPWRYAYIYELTSRHFPDLLEKAHSIDEVFARKKLVELYVNSVGVTQIRNIVKLFGWNTEIVHRTIDKMLLNRQILPARHPRRQGEWLAAPELTKN